MTRERRRWAHRDLTDATILQDWIDGVPSFSLLRGRHGIGDDPQIVPLLPRSGRSLPGRTVRGQERIAGPWFRPGNKGGWALSAACPTQAQKQGLNGAPTVRCRFRKNGSRERAEFSAAPTALTGRHDGKVEDGYLPENSLLGWTEPATPNIGPGDCASGGGLGLFRMGFATLWLGRGGGRWEWGHDGLRVPGRFGNAVNAVPSLG
jgi:hypothetical protein